MTVTLTFDSSPIKGEGDDAGASLMWILDQVQNDEPGTMRCIVFTLTFDSSPVKGEGDDAGASLMWILDQVQNDGHPHL